MTVIPEINGVNLFDDKLVERFYATLNINKDCRCININGKAWFCLYDICMALDMPYELANSLFNSKEIDVENRTFITPKLHDTIVNQFPEVTDDSEAVALVDSKAIAALRNAKRAREPQVLPGKKVTATIEELLKRQREETYSAYRAHQNAITILQNAFPDKKTMINIDLGGIHIDLAFIRERVAVRLIGEQTAEQMEEEREMKMFLGNITWVSFNPMEAQEVGHIISILNNIFSKQESDWFNSVNNS